MYGKHETLAALRNEDAEAFDSAIYYAVHKAAEVVGKEVVIKALCDSRRGDKHSMNHKWWEINGGV